MKRVSSLCASVALALAVCTTAVAADPKLQSGDYVAVIGDSITEQKRYSRILETYLTVCVPDLKITARQFGWSGETAAAACMKAGILSVGTR